MGEEQLLDLLVGDRHFLGKAREGQSGAADVVGAHRLHVLETLLGDADDVLHHAGDLAAHDLMGQPAGFKTGITVAHLAHQSSQEGHLLHHVEGQVAGAQAVVDVMGVVGDVVGDRRDLGFEAAWLESSRSCSAQ